MHRRHILAGLLVLPELMGRHARAALVSAGPLQSASDNQVIENLDIVALSGAALTISHRDVVVRNCRI